MSSDEKKDGDNTTNQTNNTDKNNDQPVKIRPPLDYVIERDQSKDTPK